MGEWTILERLLEAAVQQHSTMIGRILLTVVVIFRILIVAIVGETVYDDEQSMFVCNTLQPGCNQACYDKAFPISHIRYWVFQIIMVCTPSLCFITYSVHQSAKQKERRYSTVYLSLDRDPDSMKRDDSKKFKNTIVNGVLQNTENSTKESEPDCLEVKEIPNSTMRTTKSKMRRQEGISRFYIIQVVFRNALEIGFLVGQYFLYGFNVPAVYECDRYPCIKDVECYVSRPTEKTVFLVFMFAVSGLCVVLNLAELNHLGWRKIKTAWQSVTTNVLKGNCPVPPQGKQTLLEYARESMARRGSLPEDLWNAYFLAGLVKPPPLDERDRLIRGSFKDLVNGLSFRNPEVSAG
ncbi:Gap junction delta-2 protein [Triplophysa tibetana]|uniref:Gap junction protein n=1 Tax=Triplophysa tibetana TaxID=1572043 RepID=A0A5A9NKY9_9TELE|nr:Gap junction delta-2 protein [Triplophysa tibetana]